MQPVRLGIMQESVITPERMKKPVSNGLLNVLMRAISPLYALHKRWMYGFPKKLTQAEYDGDEFDMLEWLKQNGYPNELVEGYGELFYVRTWSVN